MEVNSYLNKFTLLLQYVAEGKVQLDQNYTEQIIKFLKDPSENSPGKQILEAPYFFDLIFQSIEKLISANDAVKVFIIEIVTLLFRNELKFTKMQMLGFQALCCRQFCVLNHLCNDPPANLHLACIKLATMEVTHCSGLMILIDNKAWIKVLRPQIHHRPKKISEAAYNFIAKLAWKLDEYKSEQELIEVLTYVVEPILTSRYLHITDLNTELDEELADKIYPYLNALFSVMSESDKYAPVNRIMYLLKDHFIIGPRLFDIYRATKNLCLLKLLNSCVFRLFFGCVRRHLYTNETEIFCTQMAAFHRNILSHAINKREAFVVIDFVIQSNLIWSNFEKLNASDLKLPLTFEKTGEKIEFSLQLIVHLTIPLLKYAVRCFKRHQSTDVVEHFLIKMGRTLTDYIYSSCHLFGQLLEEGSSTFRKSVAIHALKDLLRLRGLLSKAQAGSLFQSLYYSLEMFIVHDGAGELIVYENPMDHDDLRLLSHMLEAMKMLLKDHHIHWYENLEIVNVQADLLNLLKQNFLTLKHVVQVLDLLNICVSKFISPNMSLLIENNGTQDNTLTEIGKVIRLYAQYDDWEIRDSAFNLLHTCTEISFIKYIPLQKVIKENNLMTLAMKAALTDPDFYPQCTALNCLTAATKIDNIWHELLVANPNLNLQLNYILKNHDEGMVRRVAVNVLTGIYSNQKLSVNCQRALYEVMLTAALDDLHWEVQLAALDFWKKAIYNQLSYRGFIDGKFPAVTFSKVKRKIIVLNNKEIQKQLSCIMNHLSNIGCLTVLLECMKDVHNIGVIERAHCMARALMNMLDEHHFEKVIENEKMEPTIVLTRYVVKDINIPVNLSITSEDERNLVIDNILSEYQSDLIVNIHDNYGQISFDQMDINTTSYEKRELFSADQFMETFRSNDYLQLIENKKNSYNQCVNTLHGVLDEILNI